MSDQNVLNAWDWLDENRLIMGVLDDKGNTTTELLTRMGSESNYRPILRWQSYRQS
ncbi:MAG: hypothetical protein U0401_18925 [Anaerolineae bacterium]